jgi:glycosyltransferase involved in cell wall biosynthesis
MKVILDISSVGDNVKNRTGVARVAWTLTNLLHQKLGDNLSFSATGSINASMQAERLLAAHPDFCSAIAPINQLARDIELLQEQPASNSHNSINNLLQKIKRPTLRNISRFFNVTRQPIDPDKLASADIFHSTYPRIPQQVRKVIPHRHLQTVYDLTPLILDEKYFLPGQRGINQRLIDTIQPDDWVTTISDSARNDLLARRSQLSPDRIITIYLAAAPELFYPVLEPATIDIARQKYQLPPGNYFLSLHSLAPHKNMEHLISCFNQVIAQERIEDLNLVICGGNKNSATVASLADRLTPAEQKKVYFTGFVDDRDLAAIYSGAMGFIFPSLYEGFGLPLLEAMQCGCPVISSNTSSMPEVVGDAGFLVAPTDRDALCESILKLYLSNNLRSEYARLSMERAALFSWQKTLAETLELYDKILQNTSKK